jgi:hypothetical protein
MELKKEKLFVVENTIKSIELNSLNIEKIRVNSKLSYVFMRNKLKFKKTSNEKDEIIKFLTTSYNESIDKTEDEIKSLAREDNDYEVTYNKELTKFISESDKFKDFLEETINIEFFKIKADDLEGCELGILSEDLIKISEYVIED